MTIRAQKCMSRCRDLWKEKLHDKTLLGIYVVDYTCRNGCLYTVHWRHTSTMASNHRRLDCLVNGLLLTTNNTVYIRATHYWIFVRGTTDQRWVSFRRASNCTYFTPLTICKGFVRMVPIFPRSRHVSRQCGTCVSDQTLCEQMSLNMQVTHKSQVDTKQRT